MNLLTGYLYHPFYKSSTNLAISRITGFPFPFIFLDKVSQDSCTHNRSILAKKVSLLLAICLK
jgi:hypothetical protein